MRIMDKTPTFGLIVGSSGFFNAKRMGLLSTFLDILPSLYSRRKCLQLLSRLVSLESGS
jgi:hypothetical protein